MAVHTIKKGLDLPILGDPDQSISDAPNGSRVAVMAADYIGMRPKMAVKVGDEVKRGQLLFQDRKMEGVRHTSPAAGKIVAVNRGEFRALQSIVIELSPSEKEGKPAESDFQTFESYTGKPVSELSREELVALLAESGWMTAFRMRPHGRVPSPQSEPPNSIFVTASDTNPHAAKPEQVLKGKEADFERGLEALTKLSGGKVFLCKSAGSPVSAGKAAVQVEEFAGPHPSGTVGYHIHVLDPVNREKTVWHINYQDVVGLGRLVASGKLDVERVVSLAGPSVQKPRVLRTRIGASLDELTAGELREGENRVISGSALFGRTSNGQVLGYLGRYHLQVSALTEGRERELFGWLKLGADKFTISGSYASAFTGGGRKYDMNTNINGGHRAQVPIGMYERVFPFDIFPTFLLRSLLVKDLTRAEELGALELDEEDLALCTFVCPNKQDYVSALRSNLDEIWKEG